MIGRRRLDTHFMAFETLGAEVDLTDGLYVRAEALTGAEMFLDEPSVTGTENAVMAAVMANGRTRIRNAASEPHVQDLCAMLCAMGAHIEAWGPTRC